MTEQRVDDNPVGAPVRAGASRRSRRVTAAVTGLLLLGGQIVAGAGASAATPSAVFLTGELERVFLDAPGDVYAGGEMVIAGQAVVIPRNLLMDLPANRLTLQQLFAQAPAACTARLETGLARADACNAAHTGAIVTIAANRTRAGDVIAGDVFVQKGVETVKGVVTHLDYAQGSFRLDGDPSQPATGVLVRLNDPTGRHTVQQGDGCAEGAPNCSADPRFGLDADNYTSKFTTGYPLCLPSTQPRPFTDRYDVDDNANTGSLVAQANPDGTGDVLCPSANRDGNGQFAADSRRFAPIVLGDTVTVTGNFEEVGGVRFLSSHSTTVARALYTRNAPGQPDYVNMSEAEIGAPGFDQQRISARFLGEATTFVPDVLLWSVHRDPAHNAAHEFPLGTTRGCDLAAGTCTNLANGLWRLRYDSDFIQQPTSAKLSPCAQLRRDPRMGSGFCPDRPGDDEFAVLSPLPHEIQLRTGRKVADTGGTLHTVDVAGADATNGQFLFPLGIGLGGFEMPDLGEVNLDRTGAPNIFEGIPWLMDRRLGPGGCQGDGGCGGFVQPLEPFPASGLDPRTQAVNTLAPGGATPSGPLTDAAFTASLLSNVSNRIFSYVDPALGTFNGDASLLRYPPTDPASVGVVALPPPGATGPLVSGITPSAATPLATVQIGGLGLDAATAVSFNGAPALFVVVNAGRIAAVVPPTATSGPVQVTLAGAAAPLVSPAPFTVATGSATGPAVATMTPTGGPPGTSVLLTGSNLLGATGVSFGGALTTRFTVANGGTSLSVVVPAGAVSGPVTVSTPAGAADAGRFAVTPAVSPVVASFTPASGPPTTIVTLRGAGLGAASEVRLGTAVMTGLAAVDADTVRAVVPAGAVTAATTVVTPAGVATADAPFTVEPLPPPPFADAGANRAVLQGSTVTLDGSVTVGATALSWTQSSGPTVALSARDVAKPTFTFPAAYTMVSFQLLATNAGGSSVATVTISAVPDQLTVTSAVYRSATKQVTVVAKATIAGPDNVVTVRLGSPTGPLLGTGTVDAAGNVTVVGTVGSASAPSSVALTSSRGGSATKAVTVQ